MISCCRGVILSLRERPSRACTTRLLTALTRSATLALLIQYSPLITLRTLRNRISLSESLVMTPRAPSCSAVTTSACSTRSVMRMVRTCAAMSAGQGSIEEKNVRPELLDETERIGSAAGLADDEEIRLTLEQATQPLAVNPVIVRDQDTDSWRRRHV